jgi:hypothetical protein
VPDVIEGAGYRVESRKCFRSLINKDSHYLVGQYRHYKNGLLYVGGGVSEQPAVYTDAMELIDRLIEEGRK